MANVVMEERRARREELNKGRSVMKDRIVALDKAGKKPADIATELKIRESSVRQVLHEVKGKYKWGEKSPKEVTNN